MIFHAAARLHLKDRMGYGIPFKDWDRLSKRVLGELLHVKLPKSARLGSSNWALQTKMLCHMFLLITSHNCRKATTTSVSQEKCECQFPRPAKDS